MAKVSDPWIEVSDVIPMFPTLVWKTLLSAKFRDTTNARILATLAGLRCGLPKLSVGQGWQSNQTLHERDEFRDFIACVSDVVKGVLRFLRIGHDAFEITGCWANVRANGAVHKTHRHPNNFSRGVYYVRTHQYADTIGFHDPRSQASVIRPPVVELTAADQVVVRVTNGTLFAGKVSRPL